MTARAHAVQAGSPASRGRVVGIDVGFSPTRRTTCFCLLSWDAQTARFAFDATTADEHARRRALSGLLREDRGVMAVGVDGPLAPGLALVRHYRSAEALLSQGAMQKRGKPGQTSSPTGQRLHEHATRLVTLALEEAQIDPATHDDPIHEQRIVEAFPNAFLAALVGEPRIPALQRNTSDVFWQLALTEPMGLHGLLQLLLPGRSPYPRLEDVVDQEQRAGVICALTALCVARGSYTAVGDPVAGDIILPPMAVWGHSAQNSPWLRRELDAALERVRAARNGQPGFALSRVVIADSAA